jgi:peptide deformylase
MAVRDVLQLGNPLLREKCTRVAEPAGADVAGLIADLAETLSYWRATTGYGRGIAAPQIGTLQRVVYLNRDKPWPLINPQILERSDEAIEVWDGCLSFLSIFFKVRRHARIRVRYQDVAGAWCEIEASDDLSELLQHEIDHLDGILAIDRITDLRTLCTREEFERRYRADSPYATGETSPAEAP